MARRAGLRAIYTAPLKALSNQKFRDLRAQYGAALVGLMTGDIVENPTAPIVVMTTEIYRNMLLEGSRAARQPPDASTGAETVEQQVTARDFARQAALDDELSSVGCVILDELHYLSDPERGPVWEEAIIHSPAHVTFIGLSATVSNADQLCQWINQVHGAISLVFHVERAVPLEHYYYLDGTLHLVQNAQGERVERFPGVGGEAKLARERNRPRAFVFDGTPQGQERRAERNPAAAHSGPPGAASAQGGQASAAEPAAPGRRQAPEPGETLTASIFFLEDVPSRWPRRAPPRTSWSVRSSAGDCTPRYSSGCGRCPRRINASIKCAAWQRCCRGDSLFTTRDCCRG